MQLLYSDISFLQRRCIVHTITCSQQHIKPDRLQQEQRFSHERTSHGTDVPLPLERANDSDLVFWLCAGVNISSGGNCINLGFNLDLVFAQQFLLLSTHSIELFLAFLRVALQNVRNFDPLVTKSLPGVERNKEKQTYQNIILKCLH